MKSSIGSVGNTLHQTEELMSGVLKKCGSARICAQDKKNNTE